MGVEISMIILIVIACGLSIMDTWLVYLSKKIINFKSVSLEKYKKMFDAITEAIIVFENGKLNYFNSSTSLLLSKVTESNADSEEVAV